MKISIKFEAVSKKLHQIFFNKSAFYWKSHALGVSCPDILVVPEDHCKKIREKMILSFTLSLSLDGNNKFPQKIELSDEQIKRCRTRT